MWRGTMFRAFSCRWMPAPCRGGGMVYADGSNPSVRKDIGVRLPSPARLSSVSAGLGSRIAARSKLWSGVRVPPRWDTLGPTIRPRRLGLPPDPSTAPRMSHRGGTLSSTRPNRVPASDPRLEPSSFPRCGKGSRTPMACGRLQQTYKGAPMRRTRTMLVWPATPGGEPATITTRSPSERRPVSISALST